VIVALYVPCALAAKQATRDIPIVIVAPLFIRGQVEFGVITQSAMAFAQLMGAFSLIVTQFQSLSSYAAVLARLGAFMEAAGEIAARDARLIDLKEGRNEVTFDHLTLRSPRDGRVLIYQLALSIPHGTNVLIRGDSDTVKVALVRALAGIWECSEGRIVRPGESFFVMPERPYLPPGTLRHDMGAVNMGISIVTPAKKILEVINHPGLVKMREARDAELARERVPILDVAKTRRVWFYEKRF
jgi:putative ATP-binding cassette transporter